MNNNIEAVKTEYKGIVYKSKSEAIFARGLDIAVDNKDISTWRYEPRELMLEDGYIPDFIISKVIVNDSSHTCRISIWQAVIEFKPKDVSNTYENKLKKRAKLILENRKYLKVFFLVTGSPFDINWYNNSDVRYYNDKFDGFYSMYHDDEYPNFSYLFTNWEEAKKYRFDLSQ